MFTLIKNANLYSPEHLGMNDVLLADDKIALIDRKIELTGIPFDTIDAGGCAVTPGFIDQHVHITGGGGQTGYASLVPFMLKPKPWKMTASAPTCLPVSTDCLPEH